MLTTERDYYDVLGIAPDADAATVKRAYRARARELHPDMSADPHADARFSELAEAYAVLSKSTSRMLYDRFGYRGRGNGWFGTVEGVVSHATDFGTRGRETKPLADVVVDSFEAARGTACRVKLLGTDVCPECDGSGAVRATDADLCPDCLGSGRPKQRSLVSDARLLRVEGCSTCRGTGRVQTEPCPACGGDGELATVRTVEVDVPPGTVDGDPVPVDGGVVAVRVKAPADPRLVRYGAAVLLAVALVFLVLVLR